MGTVRVEDYPVADLNVPSRRNGREDRWVDVIRQIFIIGDLPKVARATALLAHSSKNDTLMPSEIKCPGITYVQDPFQNDTLQKLFNHLQLPLLSWEKVSRFLTSGDISFFRVASPSSQDKASLESFLLVALYLMYYGTGTCDSQAVDSVFGSLVDDLINQKLYISKHSVLPGNVWQAAFLHRNLRLSGASMSHLRFNELLESIRLQKLQQDGFFNHSKVSREANRQVGLTLACSWYTVKQFWPQSNFITMRNLQILAEYADELPLSWYNRDVVHACISLGESFCDKSIEMDKDGLLAVVILIAAWAAKNDGSGDPLLMVRALALSSAIAGCEADSATGYDILSYTICVIATSIGKLPPNVDVTAIEALTKHLSWLPRLDYAQQSRVLVSTARMMRGLPQEPSNVLTEAIIKSWAPADPINPLPSAILLANLYQYVSSAWWENSGGRVPGKASWLWNLFQRRRRERVPALQEFYSTILSSSEGADVPPVSVVAALFSCLGVLQSLKLKMVSKKDQATSRSILESAAPVELVCETLLAKVASQLEDMTTTGHHGLTETIAYATSQLVALPSSNTNSDFLKKRDMMQQLNAITDTIFTDIHGLLLDENVWLDLATGSSDSLAHVSDSFARKLQNHPQNAVFANLSRLSTAAATLAVEEWKRGAYESVMGLLRKMNTFCINLYQQWEVSQLSDDEAAKRIRTDLTEHAWKYLKITLYVVTMVSRGVTDALLESATQPPEGLLAMQLLMSSLSHLHFITARFGLGGFKTWQETFDSMVFWMHRTFKAGPNSELQDLLKPVMPSYTGLSMQHASPPKCRLLFYLSSVRRLLPYLSQNYVSQEVLPRAYPYLAYRRDTADQSKPFRPTADDKDLFEVAHAISVSVFEYPAKFQNLIEGFADWYALLLIQNFPDIVDFDLLRRCFSFVIKSLSRFSVTQVTTLDDDEAVEDGMNTAPARGRSQRDSQEHMDHDDVDESQIMSHVNTEDDVLADIITKEDDGPSDETIARGKEGDLLAWQCLLRLLDRMEQLTLAIHSTTAPRSPPSQTDSPLSRREEILSMAPTVGLIMQRDQLMIVLVDQLRTISLSGLDSLLMIVKSLLLEGCLPRSFRALLLNPTATDDDTLLGDEDDRTWIGLGIETDPENSPIWKAVYDAVGHSRGFDYTRRQRCIQWYLSTLDEAKEARERRKVARKEELQIETGSNLAAPEPVLRAKL
ncbi:hypothetical protein BC832DRAFT_590015 [Gaertneriomyces semiglobifer]|nr:hypothetical protein BC832DRAFT_590015 [Gaertneriomyces semiglobifer]